MQHAVYVIINPAVKVMIRIGVTPNMVTTIGLLGNLAAAVYIVGDTVAHADKSRGMIGWAGLLILLSSLFDMVDGYLARTGKMESEFGAFYDSVLDRYSEIFTLAALTFFFVFYAEYGAGLVTVLALVGSIMVSYIRARAEGLGYECKVGLMQRPERVVVTSVGCMLCPAFSSLWPLIIAMLAIALLANGTAVVRVLHVRRQMDRRAKV